VRKIKEKYMTEHQETKAAQILKEKEEREAAQEARTKEDKLAGATVQDAV
jgi:flagellar biosynthesis chaperone FliJ